MSSFLLENPISLTNLAKRENVSTSTTWRWALHGVKQVLLETHCRGGRRFTTEEAFDRFIEATTAAAKSHPATPVSRTSRQRDRDIEDSEKYLDSQSL